MTNLTKSTGVLSILHGKAPPSSSSLLDRAPASPFPVLSPSQSQVDQLVTDFTRHATDGKSLAAIMAGGAAYRFGRLGVMSANAGAWGPIPLRFVSVATGLGTEVAAFEMTNRSLSHLNGDGAENPTLWKWNGSGGVGQGLLSSLITFGTLKSAGRLAQGENILVQHFMQDTGMVLGHQFSGIFGLTPAPTASLAEQFLHAEATNLQLAGGMALGHAMTSGRLQALERGMDLTIRSNDAGNDRRDPLRSERFSPLFALAGRAHEETTAPRSRDEREIPTIVNLLSLGGKGEKPSLPEAVNPFEAVKPEKQTWASLTRQMPLQSESLPKKVKYGIQLSILRSNGDAFEHGSMALQAGDTLLVHEEGITSHHPREVKGPAFKKALATLMARARYVMGDQRSKPVKIFMFHTHPKQDTHPGSFIQSPIYQHENGEAFTHINEQDCKAAENVLEVMVPYLREYNYTGPIEIIAGAVPARTRTQSKNPYIATYMRRIEAGEGMSEPDAKAKNHDPLKEEAPVKIISRASNSEISENNSDLYTATVVENLPPHPPAPRQVRITFVGDPSIDSDGKMTRNVRVLTLSAEEAEIAGVVSVWSDQVRLGSPSLKFKLETSESNPASRHQANKTSGDAPYDRPILINDWSWDPASRRFFYMDARLDPAIYDFKEEIREEGPVTIITGPNGFHIEISGTLVTVLHR